MSSPHPATVIQRLRNDPAYAANVNLPSAVCFVSGGDVGERLVTRESANLRAPVPAKLVVIGNVETTRCFVSPDGTFFPNSQFPDKKPEKLSVKFNLGPPTFGGYADLERDWSIIPRTLLAVIKQGSKLPVDTKGAQISGTVNEKEPFLAFTHTLPVHLTCELNAFRTMH